MCGLAGYITHGEARLTPKQVMQRKGVLKGLMLAMQDRGTHSSGVGAIINTKKGKEFINLKKAIPANRLVTSDDFDALMDWKPQIIIGHTRMASSGEVNDENSHPFVEGNIMGAHNGHVSNSLEIFPDRKVDSQAIFHALNEADNDFEKALARLKGAFAITWVNLKDQGKVYIVRNHNPLSIIKINEIQTYFWASTHLAVESVVGTVFDIKDADIWTPKFEQVYEISENFQITKTVIEFASKLETTSTSSYERDRADWSKGQEEEFYRATAKKIGGSTKACDISGECDNEDDEESEEEYNKLFADGSMVGDDLPTTHDHLLLQYHKQEIDMINEALQEKCGYCGGDFDMYNDEVFYWVVENKVAVCVSCGDEEDLWELGLCFSFDALLSRMADMDYEETLGHKEEPLMLSDGAKKKLFRQDEEVLGDIINGA